MLTDYKFWYITRQDDVHISECAVIFREGKIKDVAVYDEKMKKVGTEKRYVVSKELKKNDIKHVKGKFKVRNGKDFKVYTTEDFGEITTNDELRVFVNSELMKIEGRTPIEAQNTLDINKVK